MFLIGNGWMRVVLSYNGMPVGYQMEQAFQGIELAGISPALAGVSPALAGIIENSCGLMWVCAPSGDHIFLNNVLFSGRINRCKNQVR